jgi:hypothetical protein
MWCLALCGRYVQIFWLDVLQCMCCARFRLVTQVEVACVSSWHSRQDKRYRFGLYTFLSACTRGKLAQHTIHLLKRKRSPKTCCRAKDMLSGPCASHSGFWRSLCRHSWQVVGSGFTRLTWHGQNEASAQRINNQCKLGADTTLSSVKSRGNASALLQLDVEPGDHQSAHPITHIEALLVATSSKCRPIYTGCVDAARCLSQAQGCSRHAPFRMRHNAMLSAIPRIPASAFRKGHPSARHPLHIKANIR